MNLENMKIILYTEDKQEMGDDLQKLILHQLPTVQTDAVQSFRRLSSMICRPLNRVSVIILFVMCETDIDQFITLKPLFDNIRVILVLPDGTRDMMAPWLQLKPSFISYRDNDFSDIISVLKKIHTGERRPLK